MVQDKGAETGTEQAPRRKQPEFDVIDTFWGYILSPGKRARDRASLGEGLATIASLLFGTIAFAQWLMPSSLTQVELVPFKLAISAVFFVLAGILYLMAKKGLTTETQVDLHERQVRIVRRNRGDESLTLAAYTFGDVEEVLMKRGKAGFLRSNLYLQTRQDDTLVPIGQGGQEELEPAMNRLRQDLFGPRVVREAPARPRPRLVSVKPARSA